MEKIQAVMSLGQEGLLLPVRVKAALMANDRLKLYLTVLQAATSAARHADRQVPDLGADMAAADVSEQWLRDLPSGASCIDNLFHIPDLCRLTKCLGEDLTIMARPILDTGEDPAQPPRVQRWLEWLANLHDEQLDHSELDALTHGRKEAGDSLHLLVMDLHKALNRLSGQLASEVIDGAQVWQLEDWDRARVRAFMAGVHRTAHLKFEHPGLDTAATRSGKFLLLQNDIGTSDAHVLVLRIESDTVTLTYSDLHRGRFDFFVRRLIPYGARWSTPDSRVTSGLNEGAAYSVGTARFICSGDDALDQALFGIGSQLVFLLDWNRARKRLQAFVRKNVVLAILDDAADQEIGHRAWLQAGGEKLIFDAMQATGEGAFRIGDRLDEVLGADDARAFLLAVLRLTCEGLRDGRPTALLADETRMLLARHVRQRSREFDLLAEHAAYCHALAQAISDGLAHGDVGSRSAMNDLATKAKAWERRADHLVMQARDQAERQPRWRPFARLLEQADDVADALEEAAFLMSLIVDHHGPDWSDAVRESLLRLATTVECAVQEHVKALAIARTLGTDSDAADNDAFLEANWRVLRAERECDELLRVARRGILAELKDAPSMMLANDLANTLELASDRLLDTAYALRDVAFSTAGAGP